MVNRLIKYEMHLKNYYKKKIKYLLLQKYSLEFLSKKDTNVLEGITKIEIFFNCITISDEDLVLVNSLFFLENITGQKGFGIGKYKYIGNTKKFFFVGSITLRKNIMYNFLNYFVMCCLPIYIKRNGIIKEKIKYNQYYIRLIDLNIFPNYKIITFNNDLKIKFIGNTYIFNKIMNDILSIIKVK